MRGKRIQEAIDALNYKVDSAAQTLKTGKTHHVSILVPGSAPFYWTIIQAIQTHLSEAGYFSSVLFTRQFDEHVQINNKMVDTLVSSSQVEAYVLFPLQTKHDKELAELIKRKHDNLLVIDHKTHYTNIPCLVFDNYGAGKSAAKEFLKKGHKEFLLLTGEDYFESSQERQRGFLDGLKEGGVTLPEERIIHSSFSPQFAYPEFQHRDLPDFSAVLAGNDTTALAFIKANTAKGIYCPKDYEIIGFDNNQEYAPYTSPSLASFDQPTYDAGIKAADLILSMIEGNNIPMETVFPMTLIRRESFL